MTTIEIILGILGLIWAWVVYETFKPPKQKNEQRKK